MFWPLDHLLEAWTFSRTKFPEPIPSVYSPDLLALKALEIAIGYIGQGEDGGNNTGPFVAKCIAPAQCPQNWCAGFSGLCYQEAAAALGVKLPFKRSLGAKALGKSVAAVGRRFTDPYQAKPGDLIIFDRGATGSWQGHVGLVERVDDLTGVVHTVEGNSAPLVRRRIHNIALAGDRFSFFSSIRP